VIRGAISGVTRPRDTLSTCCAISASVAPLALGHVGQDQTRVDQVEPALGRRFGDVVRQHRHVRADGCSRPAGVQVRGKHVACRPDALGQPADVHPPPSSASPPRGRERPDAPASKVEDGGKHVEARGSHGVRVLQDVARFGHDKKVIVVRPWASCGIAPVAARSRPPDSSGVRWSPSTAFAPSPAPSVSPSAR
jgi:hypothetical protein